MAFPEFAKHGVTRSGTAVCGVLGFEQHWGVWPALLGAVGWLIAFDHLGYLLRRRYGDRARARLSRWQPKGRARSRLVTSLRKVVGDPGRLAASYRSFVVINTASAVVWAAAFVGAGYLLTASWRSGRTDWSSAALALAGAGVILGIAMAGYQRRHSPSATPSVVDDYPAHPHQAEPPTGAQPAART